MTKSSSTGRWISTLAILKPWSPGISTVWFFTMWTSCLRMTASSTPAQTSPVISPLPLTSSNMPYLIKVSYLDKCWDTRKPFSFLRNIRRRLNIQQWLQRSTDWSMGSPTSTGAGAARTTTCTNVSTRVNWRYSDTKQIFPGIKEIIQGFHRQFIAGTRW